MAIVDLVMPKMGESVMEGTILNWLKKPGDKIALDEPVLEVATDKVDTEIPSSFAGVLHEVLAQVGEVVAVGRPIARIATANEAPANGAPQAPVAEPPANPVPVAEALLVEAQNLAAPASNLLPQPAAGRFYSPLVLSIAKQEAIGMAELERLPGSGKEGRVTKADILQYVQQRRQPPPVTAPVEVPVVPLAQPTPQPEAEPVQVKPAVSFSGQADIIQMDRMRKMIAQRMVDSKRISAHVTSFVEADVTNLVHWRSANVRPFKEREGQNLTYTPVFIWAVARALRDYPLVNSSVEGDTIIVKKDVNVGLAVALPSGNLIVPVIKNADQLNLVGLTYQVNDLAKRARDNKLSPDELAGGTYTVSNIGSFGNVMGTPIILQPQVAILSLGAIQKKPAVIETETGDLIGIRHLMFLSHSYDHRIIDGALGGMFVRKVADYLENFDLRTKI
ncbi:MAG: 2-oxo acid dehydrogenase subunit E2 [Bernardetiaceae bacterium]|jgi:2-oxoglutarate dehydrogenase E2 component (dihydrolipoamide succinyltransferase)|nr:2-oxo acid dehydrogenase subunit E2 [Bernardetiaceae bacterium]